LNDSGFEFWGLGLKVSGFEFGGSGFKVSGFELLGCRVEGFGLRVLGSGLKVLGFEFLGLGFKVFDHWSNTGFEFGGSTSRTARLGVLKKRPSSELRNWSKKL